MTQGDSHDFDFLHGSWRIHHRRLLSRLTGCTEWEEFDSETTCRAILGGAGNIDEGELPGYSAMALRLFDKARQEWSIYWITDRSSVIEPPVVGTFTDGRGEFYGPDTHEGIPVLVRFQWSDITPVSARWEQALSTDDGATWETNWIMDFTRTA